MREPVKDLVVIIPGILGSELWKDGKMLWGFPDGVSGLLRFKGNLLDSLEALKLKEHDPTAEKLDDGVRATRLLTAPQVVAGLTKSDGYDKLRNNLFQNFQLRSDDSNGIPANYLEFPYDWRRDNRASAKQLGPIVNTALEKLRGIEPDAKVIFICYSMGGLIARFYLECLNGWGNCRALITLGTPYRGSVSALNFLANGYKLAGVELTDVLRTCTSVYQLLPIYPMIDDGSDHERRVCELAIEGLSKEKARDAIDNFHQLIANSIAYRQNRGYDIFTIAGVDQVTLQSADYDCKNIRASDFIPTALHNYLSTGDGTVPLLSTIPRESTGPLGEIRIPCLHAMLQSDDVALGHVNAILHRLEDDTLEKYQGFALSQNQESPALQVQIPDFVCDVETATIQARILRPKVSIKHLNLIVQGSSCGKLSLEMTDMGEIWKCSLPQELPNGVYRAKVESVYKGPGAPKYIEDVFEIRR